MIIINGIKTNQYSEPIIKQSINELDKLSFKLPNELISETNNEDVVIYKDHSYIIKEIDNNKVYCIYDVDELLEIYIESKVLTALTIKDNMDKLLEGSGWTCEGDNSTDRRAFTFNNTNIYDAVMDMADKYDYEVRFDNVLKKVYFAAELGSDKGAYAAKGLNLSSFNVNKSTYDYATRIEPRGQDGMTIAEVNGGVTYLENKSVTDKTITFYWEDNRYTVKENLKEAAEKKLKELAEIKVTYEINITDLAALSDKYSILEYGLGDTIRVIGKEVKQRIVNLERHDYDPTKNKCTLASAAVRLSSSTDDIRKEILTNYEITSTNLWLLDDEIKARVKTEQYEQDKSELGGTLTTMQSDIVQNATAITSRVSKTEILTDPEIRDALKGEDGEPGEPGEKGDPGESITIKGSLDSVDELPPTANEGDVYSVVGADGTTITLYSYTGGKWINIGQLEGGQGTSVSKVTPQYYLSTSKTSVTGGSWGTELPAWKKNTYIWTRLEIDYVNPTKTEYTTAVLDTVNNALNEVYDSGIILPSQKPQLLIKLAEIVEEYKVLNTEENNTLSAWEAYESAYEILRESLDNITKNMTASTEINVTSFKAYNENYASAYADLQLLRDQLNRDELGDLEQRVTSAESKIEDGAIIDTVMNHEKFKEGVLDEISTFTQTTNDFTAKINKSMERLDGIENSDVMNYFTFTMDEEGNGYTELGSNIDGTKLRQYRDRISFMNGETELAYFANNAMNVDELNTTAINLGNYTIKARGKDILEFWWKES